MEITRLIRRALQRPAVARRLDVFGWARQWCWPRPGAHRRQLTNPPLAGALTVTLVVSLLLFVPTAAPPDAEAATLPPGGLVESTPNFGWTNGSFAVTDDGAATYSLPLWAPQGRGLSTPQLSLSYSSRAGNGQLGVGWALDGLPSISRCPRTHAIDGRAEGLRFDASDVFCLGSDRLIPMSAAPGPNQVEYRTERDSFARIIRYAASDYFKVWTKDRQILTFGQTADSRLTAYPLKAQLGAPLPKLQRASTTKVSVSWAVNRVEDRNGNAATVEYARADGGDAEAWWAEMRPLMVRYGPNRRVEFRYQDRPDAVDGFGAGVHTRNRYRMNGIAMYGGPQGEDAVLLREYRLRYVNTSITGRSLLTEIQECDGGGKCKLTLPLSYTPGSNDFDAIELPHITDVGTTVKTGNRIIPLDIDGDGYNDLLYPDAANNWKLRSSTGSGFGAARAAGIPRIDADTIAEIKLVDVNLDGRTDVLAQVPEPYPMLPPGCGPLEPGCRPNPDRVDWRLFKSDGFKFVPAEDLLGDYSGWNADDIEPDPVYFADLDGNGTPDVITAAYEKNGGESDVEIDGPWRYRLNDGTEAGGLFQPAVNMRTTLAGAPARVTRNAVLDTDGDGRSELVGRPKPDDDPGTSPFSKSLGLSASGSVEIVDVPGFAATADDESNIADYNGDGLLDVLVADTPQAPDQLRLKFNSANGLGTSDDITYAEVERNALRIVDFDGDGRHDVMTFRSTTSTPTGIRVYRWNDNNRFASIGLNESVGTPTSNGFAFVQPLDINADRMQDIVHVKDGHLRILKRKGGQPDQLTGVGLSGAAPRVEVTYTTLADRNVHTPCTGSYPLYCPAAGDSVVSTHKTATYVAGDAGQWDTTKHTYQAARIDLRGRGWLGFAQHTRTRELTGAVSVTEFNNAFREPGLDAYPFAGLPKKTTLTVTTGSSPAREHRRITIYDHDVRRLPLAGTYTVDLKHVSALEQERQVLLGAPWQQLRLHTTDTTYDNYGNADLVVSQTVGGRKVTEDPEFRNDTGQWLIGLPTSNRTTACTTAAGTVCTTRFSTFEYDAKGNPTLSVTEPGNAQLTHSTATAYGQFGLVTSITRSDGAGNTRVQRFEYATADKLHATATVNALGHRTLYETHSGLGVTLRVTDPNGVAATMRYDGFGRLRETNHADGGFERVSHASFIWQMVTVTDAGGTSASTMVDQLGRTRQRKVTSFDGRDATSVTDYDPAGRMSRESVPYLPGEAVLYTSYEYDNLDRVVRVTAPDANSVRYEYERRLTHTYDAENNHSYTEDTVDGDVKTSFEDDPNSAGWLQTKFEYGPFGENTKVIAPDNTAQVMTYDVLGRRTGLVDPSAGTTSTTYNGFGELVTDTNGANQVIELDYDKLGRVTKSTSPDGIATTIWDTAAHGKGKVAKTTSADSVVTVHTYDEYARPASSNWTIPGRGGYRIDIGYDDIGRANKVTYPAVQGISGRLAVEYQFNEHGYLKQVKDAAAAGPVYWIAEARNATAEVTTERYHNGVVTEREYSPATGLMKKVTATGPGNVGKLTELSYSYDANRNVAQRRDALNARYERYEYDELDRLDKWTVAPTATASPTLTSTFQYNKVGNLTEEHTTAPGKPAVDITYAYGQNGAPPHALTKRNADQYTYDDAGRQITGPQRTATYNVAGLPKVLDWAIGQGGGQHTTFRYDAAGARVLKSDAAQTVVTVGDLFEQRINHGANTAVQNIHHVVVEGRIIAEVARTQATPGGPQTDTDTSYLVNDRQGSVVHVTNQNGGSREKLFYHPFGDRVDVANAPLPDGRRGGPRNGYTGHEHDDEFGLINMQGRMYDPEARRFLTPDRLIADPLSSQSYNRYSYVANNPVTLVDPSGMLLTEPSGVRDHRSGGGRGSFGSGFSALGYPSGGQVGWSGGLGAPLITHAPDAANRYSSGMSFPNVDGNTVQQGLAEAVQKWYEQKAKEEAAANPKMGDVFVVEGEGFQGFVQINRTYFWQIGNQYWVLFPGDGNPTQVSKTMWQHGQFLAATGEAFDRGGKRDWTIVVPVIILASHEIQMFFVGGSADAAVTVGRGVRGIGRAFGNLFAATAKVATGPSGPKPAVGQTVYRVFGGDSKMGGASWTPIDPRSVKNFRDVGGLPSGKATGVTNSGAYVIEATLNDPSKVVLVRGALPLDGNRGGLLEYIIPGWRKNGAVTVTSVTRQKPPF